MINWYEGFISCWESNNSAKSKHINKSKIKRSSSQILNSLVLGTLNILQIRNNIEWNATMDCKMTGLSFQ